MDTHKRAIAKAICWRVFGTAATTLIAWIFTGRADIAGAIGLSDFVFKESAFYFHERIWERVPYGRVAVQAVSENAEMSQTDCGERAAKRHAE